jgi:proteasome beta subunit
VKLPRFAPGEDPGPDFLALLRTQGLLPPFLDARGGGTEALAGRGVTFPFGDHHQQQLPPMTHATTICAIRFTEGVVMAGDRRATAGNIIAHRSMDKIYAADRHSGVAIAGAAGAAMEMVKLFQLQLEHYEKSEGVALSFEGKANTLAQMVRQNLPAAMQMGMVVVPLFAGYDLRRRRGRIFTYDYTGGRYEETDYQAEGSGGRDARTTIKLGWREDISRDDSIDLAIRALFEAADEDSATGGPDPIRGIYPTIATVTESGFEDVAEEEIARRFDALIEEKRLSSNGSARRQPATTTTTTTRGTRRS